MCCAEDSEGRDLSAIAISGLYMFSGNLSDQLDSTLVLLDQYTYQVRNSRQKDAITD